MKERLFGNTGIRVSEIGLGCWQLGGDWGEVSDETANRILETSLRSGVNFLDTADVYGGGRSESIIGSFLKSRKETIFTATKIGRESSLYPDHYSLQGLRAGVTRSLKRLQTEALDLLQLHCIPEPVMADGEIFDWLRILQKEGLIRHFGASVESMQEAMLCMQQEGIASLQIIFNIFRQKPVDTLFAAAREKHVGLIVRLPLASGLLAGKFSPSTRFSSSDHRFYNRDGQAFNVGETFAGLPFEKGLAIVEKLRPLVPKPMSMAQMAVRWILDFDAVSVVIPGASRPDQAAANAAVSEMPPLSGELHDAIRQLYETDVKLEIRGPY